MSKSYCLTVEVKSANIENGLGYMIGFCLPPGSREPSDMAEFEMWSEEVRNAVLKAGDLPFNPDPYTKKLATAELMHSLSDINSRYNIQIGKAKDVPAVQIHSSNPYDSQIDIDFTDRQGHFRVTETSLADKERAHVIDHGRTAVIDSSKTRFPFDRSPPTGTPKHPPFRPRF